MGYDLLILAAAPSLDGTFRQVGVNEGAPTYCSRMSNLWSLLRALDPSGKAVWPAWMVRREAREEYDGEGIPASLLWDPRPMKTWVSGLQRVADTHLRPQDFRFLVRSNDQQGGWLYTDLLLYRRGESWSLEAGPDFCQIRQASWKSPLEEVDVLACAALDTKITQGLTLPPTASRAEKLDASRRADSGEQPDQVSVTALIGPADARLHFGQIVTVCDYATKHGYLIDIDHSF